MSDILRQSQDPQTPEDLYRLYRSLSEQLRGQLSQIENEKHDLEVQMMERVGNLESRNLELREQLRQVEADKRYIETQKIRYEREVRKLKSESEQLRSPTLIIGTITDVVDTYRVIVRSSAGPRFMVRSSPSIAAEELKPGVRCALQPAVACDCCAAPRPALDAGLWHGTGGLPAENLSDIGGLEAQINEIKEAVDSPKKT